jgi:hypothetical protein
MSRSTISEGARAPDVELNPAVDGTVGRFVDRRTLLVGAAGALVAAGLTEPARAAQHAGLLAARSAPRFDPAVARELQKVLRTALRDPSMHAPGGILQGQPETRPLDRRRRPGPCGAGGADAAR